MLHNHILPFVFDSEYLYKNGVTGVELKSEAFDTYVYVYYNLSDINNRKLFYYLLDKKNSYILIIMIKSLLLNC
jgi:hypothetical protein